jgi:hypothetical protein
MVINLTMATQRLPELKSCGLGGLGSEWIRFHSSCWIRIRIRIRIRIHVLKLHFILE